MTEEKLKVEEQRDRALAEILIRVASLEKLLINKKIITQDELLNVVQESVGQLKSELEKMVQKKAEQNFSSSDVNN